MTQPTLRLVAIAAILSVVAVGCGGGGGSAPPGGQAGTGSIAVAVRFPDVATQASQGLPAAARSVVFYVYPVPTSRAETGQTPAPMKPLVSPVVVKRQSGQTTVRATITKVPPGRVLVVAAAYSSENPPLVSSQAEGINLPENGLVAEASVPADVTAGRTTVVRMTATRLPTRLEITGPDDMYPGEEITYAATAYDADGQAVMGAEFQWSGGPADTLECTADGTARAIKPGDATIEVVARMLGHQWTARKPIVVRQPEVIGPALVADTQQLDLQPGGTAKINLQGYTRHGRPVQPEQVVWHTSSAIVATVAADGTVTAHRPGVAVIAAEAIVDSQRVVTRCKVNVGQAPAGQNQLAGSVRDDADQPVELARVETSNGEFVWSTLTDADGNWQLPGIPDGARVITAARRDMQTAHVAVNVGTAQAAGGINVVLRRADQPPTSPPELNVNDPAVNNTVGHATIAGRITNLDTLKAVAIVNGREILFDVAQDGSFNFTAILVPGDNTIFIRAANAVASVMSRRLTATFQPEGDMFFRVTLTWDRVTDEDLHVIDPNGDECYFGNTRTNTGELDHDNISDPPGTPENFTCTNAVPGRYQVWVKLYSGDDANCQIRVLITRGPTAPQVVDIGPRLVGPDWHACDVVVEPDGRIWVDVLE